MNDHKDAQDFDSPALRSLWESLGELPEAMPAADASARFRDVVAGYEAGRVDARPADAIPTRNEKRTGRGAADHVIDINPW